MNPGCTPAPHRGPSLLLVVASRAIKRENSRKSRNGFIHGNAIYSKVYAISALLYGNLDIYNIEQNDDENEEKEKRKKRNKRSKLGVPAVTCQIITDETPGLATMREITRKKNEIKITGQARYSNIAMISVVWPAVGYKGVVCEGRGRGTAQCNPLSPVLAMCFWHLMSICT